MGVLDNGIQKGLSVIGLSDALFTNNTEGKPRPPDFQNGFEITEIINGKIAEKPIVQLRSFLMPEQPFEFGGQQRLVKENYVGNNEAVVHVLGTEEPDVSIKGRLWLKNLKPKAQEFDNFVEDLQLQLDKIRMRGNVLQLRLGTWVRYGFLAETKFIMKTRRDINYELRFVIVSFTPPVNNKFNSLSSDLAQPNKSLQDTLNKALNSYQQMPKSMPRSLSDYLNEQISLVADAINLVTDFIDSALTDLENLEASANRALGLIKNARAKISATRRRLGAIALTASNLGSAFATEAQKTSATYNNASHINKINYGFTGMVSILALLQARYAALASTVPLRRHLVQDGDTLQKLSMKYYRTADNWKKIYDHNKLTTTELVVSSVLEIPRL